MSAIFAPVEGPRVFALPPGADFAKALVAGLDTRLEGAPPEALARVEIWVNTQRARRALLAELGRGPARLMPRVRAVTELAADPRGPLDPGPPVPALRRKLELARLVGALIAAEPGLAAETAAFDLADSLAELLDEMQGEGVEPEALARLDAGEHAEHWQRSLRFLDILGDYVASGRTTDGQGRMRGVTNALARDWAESPPAHPVIVAGSTGSRGATRAFMAAVAQLPQGALVLPGFDADLPVAVWERLGVHDAGAADHPQFGFRRLSEALGFGPGAVLPWIEASAPNPERNALMSLALRPAPVTDQWRSEGAALAPSLERSVAGLVWVEAAGERAEARAIALALRDAAAGGTRAALVTPDRMLARRVTAELGRWGLIPDDSAGRPLALTPPGVLLARLARLAGEPLTPEALLILLKHPLVGGTAETRGPHRTLTARLEMRLLRGGPPQIGESDLAAWGEEEGGAAPAWVRWLWATLTPLAATGRAPLTQVVARHRAAADALAAGPEGGAHGLWEKAAGTQALALMRAFAAEADAYGQIRPLEYRALLRSLMASRDVAEDAVVTHPDIAIWGTLEARVQSADLVILGGLNEGVWPQLPGADPWLSRAMRARLGLPSPERRIGLSAHDFQQACGAPRVILSRAVRNAEAPTVPARWLLRLENLLRGLGAPGEAALAAARDGGAALLTRAAAIDRPLRAEPPAPRPAPRPPLAARPTALSVTQIEALVRDPYDIYARKVLRLRPLDPPGRIADALARGTAIHEVLERFLAALEREPETDPRALFHAAGVEVLRTAAPWPAVHALWAARLDRAAGWFVETEAERSARATPVARERKGRRALEGLAQPFSVTAKADRIDRLFDGGYAIYDYKSGGVPGAKEASDYHLQLWLEAAITEAGGFENLPAARTRHLELIGVNARETRALDAAPEKIADIWTRLHRLIAQYQDPSAAYVARLRLKTPDWRGDYDHLARLGEWADGDRPDPAPDAQVAS